MFESQPVGIKSGPFFNLVVSAYTDLPLMELDRRLKFIEADNGRYAPDRQGLPLDIDVLLYGDLVGKFRWIDLAASGNSEKCFCAVAIVVDRGADRVHPGVGQELCDAMG